MSLAARVAVAIAGLTVTTSLLVTSAAVVSTTREVNNDVDRFLRGRAEQIADGTRQFPTRRLRNDERRPALEALSELDLAVELPAAVDSDAYVQTIDSEGAVLVTIGEQLPVSEVDETVARRTGLSAFQDVSIDDAEYRMYTTGIVGGGAVQVAISVEESRSLITALRSRLILIGSVFALMAALAGWIIARRSLQPLKDLTAAAEHVANTQSLASQIPVSRNNDEIGRLATSFNEMLDALAASKTQQHQLVQDAAHELRTPLTSVNANIDLLSHAPDLPAVERKEILTGIRAELRHLGTLFNEIIELATDKRQQAIHTRIDLVDVVEAAVEDLERREENPVLLELSSCIVEGEFKALKRAVSNLLSNASKYSPDGSQIIVSVTQGRVAVQDSGPGIPAELRDKVFDRFYRSVDARSMAGSGLGLAIVAKIVSDHGGSTFVADANPGPGAVVGFTLPEVPEG